MRYIVAVFLGLIVHCSVRAQEEPVLPTADADYIGQAMWLLEDTHSVFTPEQALKHSFSRPSRSPVPNLGISRSTFWTTFTIENRSNEDHVLIELEHAEVEHIDLYLVRSGIPEMIATGGQGTASASSSQDIPGFVFDVPLEIGASAKILIRLASSKQLQVPLRVHLPSSFAKEKSLRNLLIGAYIGIMIALALYNLFVYLSIRDRTYIIYVAYILLVTLTQLAFWGIGQSYLWPGAPWFSVKASIIFTFATAIAASEFMKLFLDTRKYEAGLHRLVKYFYALFALVLVLYLFIDPYVGYRAAQVSAGMFASLLFVTAWRVWKHGSPQGGYFLVAWSAFLLGTMIFSLKDMGLLPYNALTVFAMPVGSAIEGILLSFALANKINILRKEKERSQAEALAASLENQRIIREQNVTLEQMVKERTQELSEANEHLKRTQTQLVSAEKMASLGQLTAGIAHEINNPINFITSNIQPLKRNISEIVEVMAAYRALTPGTAADGLKVVRERESELGITDSIDELDDIIQSISEGSHRTAEIVKGLRNFSRLDEDDLKDTDLNQGIRSTLALLAPQLRDKVRIDLELEPTALVECFPGKVNQVFMNILTNAVQATLARTDRTDPRITIATRPIGEEVLVSFADNGIGMSEAVKARIFDPFFTTKAVGEGTGLGLAIVHGIIEDHQGRIAVESAEGQGSVFCIHLPIRRVRTTQLRA